MSSRHPDYADACRRCDVVRYTDGLAASAGYRSGEEALKAYCARRGVPFVRGRFDAPVPGGADAFLDWLKGEAASA